MFILTKYEKGIFCGLYLLLQNKYFYCNKGNEIRLETNVEWFQNINIEYWSSRRI